MLVYTTLFTLSDKLPENNKYIDMFYIWFTYLKRYGGLTPNDCVGLLVDEDTLNYMNSKQPFGYLSLYSPFSIQISIIPRPKNVLEGVLERYNIQHFTEYFTENLLNVYIDIDCLVIKNLPSLFRNFPQESTFFAFEEGLMTNDVYAKDLLSEENTKLAENLPGFTSGLFAWTHTPGQLDFLNSVVRGCKEWKNYVLYSLDQPFFNYELFLRMTQQKEKDFKICVIDKSVIAYNPLVFDTSLNSAYFANFCGKPGVDSCHYNKMIGFMYVSMLYMERSLQPPEVTYSNSKNEFGFLIEDENRNEIDTEFNEKDEQVLANRFIEADDIVLELGARYGSVSCVINSKLSCKTNQVSVEPDKTVWAALERNKTQNKCEFHILNGFLSGKKLTLEENGYSTFSKEDRNSSIPCLTLDEIQKKYNLDFNVLVADCEGYLETFLDENPNFLSKLRLVIFEADGSERCNYERIRFLLKNSNFKEIVGGFQNVWMSEVTSHTVVKCVEVPKDKNNLTDII
jgi:FkbM family methyltransferase